MRPLLVVIAALLIAQSAPLPPNSSEDLPLGRPHATAPGATAAGSSDGYGVVRTAGALALIIGLIIALRFVLQRLSGSPSPAAAGRLVELLGRSNIGPRTHILFLRINRQIIVASQTPQGLSTLAVLDQPDDIAWVLAQTQDRGFRSILGKFEHRSSERAAPAEAKTAALLERLRAIKRGEQ